VELCEDLGISLKASQETMARTVIESFAYSPTMLKLYRVSQKLKGQVKLE
jgi:hypothetical protein